MQKTLVMIPAFGCDARLYAPQIEKLAQSYAIQVIVPTADGFAGMVEEVLAQAPGRFVILGTSMGGRLALEVTLAAPDRVAGLVVIGAGAGGVADPAAGLRRSARLRGGDMEGVLREMGDMIAHMSGPRGPETREAFITMGRETGVAVMAAQSDALAHRADRWAASAAIACPTLCLWGVHDQFSPAADGRRLAQTVQQGRYAELPDCGHFPSLEYPAETTALIENWLQAVDYAASA